MTCGQYRSTHKIWRCLPQLWHAVIGRMCCCHVLLLQHQLIRKAYLTFLRERGLHNNACQHELWTTLSHTVESRPFTARKE